LRTARLFAETQAIFDAHESVVEFREFVKHHLFKPGYFCIEQLFEVAKAIVHVAEPVIHVGSQICDPAIVVQESDNDDGQRTHKGGKRNYELGVVHG